MAGGPKKTAEVGKMKQEGSFRRCNAYLVIVTNPKKWPIASCT